MNDPIDKSPQKEPEPNAPVTVIDPPTDEPVKDIQEPPTNPVGQVLPGTEGPVQPDGKVVDPEKTDP